LRLLLRKRPSARIALPVRISLVAIAVHGRIVGRVPTRAPNAATIVRIAEDARKVRLIVKAAIGKEDPGEVLAALSRWRTSILRN
jgi:hypothetical protein